MRVASKNGSSFSCTIPVSRSERTRSISAFGKLGCSATSASNSSASGKFRESERVDKSVVSVPAPVLRVAPSSAARSAICSAERVAVPCCSIRAVMLASPGRSMGLTPLPACKTRFAATSGSPGRSLYSTVNPLESLNFSGTGRCSALATPGFGASFRHAASAFTASPLFLDGSFCPAFGVATSGPRSCFPGSP